MRVLIASDKFAGTLTASQACEAIRLGWLEERANDEVRCVPMADGGPGTVDVVATSGRGTLQTSATLDHRGQPLEAQWLSLDDATALIEVSAACGLDLVPASDRRPAETMSEGVGLLLADVFARGYRRVIVGLGGTGTVDGGLGAALGAGARALGRDGEGLRVRGPIDFDSVASVTPVRLTAPTVIAATDVSNPLLGPNGAARVFGPQKGADTQTVELLEARLSHLADVVEESLPGGPWRETPGAGAGGGLGFGLMAWMNAAITGGAELVADLVDLGTHVEWADVVITGEGSLDEQSLRGKTPASVAGMARHTGRPVLAVAGRADGEVVSRFARVVELGDAGLSDPHGQTRLAGARLASQWDDGMAGGFRH